MFGRDYTDTSAIIHGSVAECAFEVSFQQFERKPFQNDAQYYQYCKEF